MRVLVTLLIAALPFVLSVPAPPSENNALSVGFAIPISRLNEVCSEDGVVNLQSLKANTQRSISGILRGLLTYQINTGMLHPLAKSLGHCLSSLKRETGSLPLVDADSTLWYGNIEVGTPAVTFAVLFDAGSSDIFLPSTGCDCSCDGHTRYNPSASGTDLNKPFELKFASGESVTGELYNDTVSIAGLTADNQTLGAALTYSSELAASNFLPDGLVGLGYQQISVYNSPPLFKTLIAQRRVTQPQFAFKLASTGSELYLGGTNRQLYNGSFTYVPVTTQGFWQTDLAGVAINGVPIQLSQRSAVIDTGTTVIIGDKKDVENIYDQIPGSKPASDTLGKGLFTIPCDFDTVISFRFGIKTFSVSPNIFNLGPVSEGSNDCIGGLIYSPSLSYLPFWVIGGVFLRNVYTVFDMGKNAIGFADLTSAPS